MSCFQNISEINSRWLVLEEERFWARPTSTKVGTELTKVGTELAKVGTVDGLFWVCVKNCVLRTKLHSTSVLSSVLSDILSLECTV